jgi:DNA-binding IclR family transcriptional regulator
LLRRMGLGPSDARRQLSQLRDLGLLQPRRARDDGSYRLVPGLSEIAARDEALSLAGSGLSERILEALGETDSASREELQEATGASRSSVINALDHLITIGIVEATAPPRSPNRRYRRTRS